MAGRLSKGDIIVLFAEGTSSDGNKVLPFRSALVGAAQRAIEDGGAATVQPVAIAYRKMLGLPLGRQHRPLVAWYGGTDLLPHLKRVLSEGGIDVHVVFGPARSPRRRRRPQGGHAGGGRAGAPARRGAECRARRRRTVLEPAIRAGAAPSRNAAFPLQAAESTAMPQESRAALMSEAPNESSSRPMAAR